MHWFRRSCRKNAASRNNKSQQAASTTESDNVCQDSERDANTTTTSAMDSQPQETPNSAPVESKKDKNNEPKTQQQQQQNQQYDLSKSLSSLDGKDVEVVDPEQFFEDPDQVLSHKEEQSFRQLLSEWEIIESPASNYTSDNIFSAGFEEELLQLRTHGSNEANLSLHGADMHDNETAFDDFDQDSRQKFLELLCGNKIQLGFVMPSRCSSMSPATGTLKRRKHVKKRRIQLSSEHLSFTTSSDTDATTNSNAHITEVDSGIGSCEPAAKKPPTKAPAGTCQNNIPKDCAIDREKLKTEALAGSIMGAIGKCPDMDGTSGISDNDLTITSSAVQGKELKRKINKHRDLCHPARYTGCDHYDIKKSYHLDDYGNILLNMSHIAECKGFGFTVAAQNKRLYRRYRRECEIIQEVRMHRECCGFDCGSSLLIKCISQLLWRALLGHPRNKISPFNGSAGGPGDSVRCYTLQLAQDPTTTFARNIENFICCTKESREAAPQVVMRNMRQFMNGMKNYLVKHGEGRFQQEVEAARERLKSDEFLNLDAILETVMHQLIVLPLREHLYGMFVDYYTRSDDIQLLAQNIKYACGRSASDFGIRPTVTPPSTTSLNAISNLLLRLQEAELPLDKLELFLCVITTVFEATGCQRGQQLGADDFLPVLVYVVAKCGFVGAEIEAEFMWGLLQPTLLNGEPGYYLTALCSAVHVLKSFMASESESGTGSLDWRSSSLPASSSVLRVIIPDECNGSLQTRTLPVRPHTTTREVCRIIAHKARITNPQDYALFKLVDGEETLLNDMECPQDIRLAAKGKHCMLAYKRIDAKIAWPTATQPTSSN